jgi:hypothetical protein
VEVALLPTADVYVWTYGATLDTFVVAQIPACRTRGTNAVVGQDIVDLVPFVVMMTLNVVQLAPKVPVQCRLLLRLKMRIGLMMLTVVRFMIVPMKVMIPRLMLMLVMTIVLMIVSEDQKLLSGTVVSFIFLQLIILILITSVA